MSNDSPQVGNLLRQGILAARQGEKDDARRLLRQVIELDQYNERAWFWLASVAETDEERHTALSNVVLINPHNTRAQELLDKLEHTEAVGAGVSKSSGQNKMMIMGVLGIFAIIILAVILVAVIGGGGDEALPTQVQLASFTETPSPTEIPPTATDIPPEVLSQTPPTATPFQQPTLPPQLTATPTPLPPEALPTLPPPPESLTGRLLFSSGTAFGDREFQPIVIMPISDPSGFTPASLDDVRGRYASFSPDGSRYVFVRLGMGGLSDTLQVSSITGANSQVISEYWGNDPIIFSPDMPSWSPVSDQVAFVGKAPNSLQNDLYIISASEFIPPTPAEGGDETPSPLRQLTSDEVEETWPAWSPDGRELVYVADGAATDVSGVDLQIINVIDGSIRFVTLDGLAVVESAPSWGGPGGNWIVYSGTAEGSRESDIWIAAADAMSAHTPAGDGAETSATNDLAPQRLVDLGPRDIQPRWSPDGQYIVFSSDHGGGRFDVYIYEFETGEIFALTNNPDRTDIANDWIMP